MRVHTFQVLKDLMNVFPKLYYIDYQSEIIFCTDASDYAILGAKKLPDVIEQPIRFLSKTLMPVLRWSTIEEEALQLFY